jgi:hypothetical protein
VTGARGELGWGGRRGMPGWRGTALALLVLGGIAVLGIAVAPPDAKPLVTRIAVLALALVVAVQLVRRTAAVTRSTPEQFEAALRQDTTPPSVIPGLRAIDQTLRMATASGFGAVFMLRPLLLELATWRLQRDRRIDLAATPELARQALGEPLWRLLQDRDVTAAWNEPGIELADLRAAVADLERV